MGPAEAGAQAAEWLQCGALGRCLESRGRRRDAPRHWSDAPAVRRSRRCPTACPADTRRCSLGMGFPSLEA